MGTIDWDREKLEEFLKDKERAVTVDEYMLLIDFLEDLKPEVIVDIGTYLGASAYVLSRCCKHTYTIDNINSPEYYDKPEAKKEDHAKYIDRSNTTFMTKGYENGIFDDLAGKHPDMFVFWDAGKNTMKVLRQFELSYANSIYYIAIHDSSRKSVRRAINRAKKLGWYQVLKENTDNPDKGLTILEMI